MYIIAKAKDCNIQSSPYSANILKYMLKQKNIY